MIARSSSSSPARRLAPLSDGIQRREPDDGLVELVARVVLRVAERLAHAKLVLAQALGDVLDAQALVAERLSLANEGHLRGEAHRDREGIGAALEVRLAGGQRAREVARAPGVHDRPGGGLLGGRGEELDLAPADRLAGGPGGQLLDLGRESVDVLADDLDQRASGLAVAPEPRTRSNWARTQVGRSRGFGTSKASTSPALAQAPAATEPFSSPATSASTAPWHRVGEVAGDGLLVGFLPALDVLDDHKAPAVAREEAERVQRCDGFVAADGSPPTASRPTPARSGRAGARAPGGSSAGRRR